MKNVNTLLSPPYLQIGDKVGIIAPAKKVEPQEISHAIHVLESWGLEVVLGEHLYKSHYVFAGTDLERTEDLQKMLDRQDIRAIVCARGGYGTSRIVDNLDFTTFKQNPKWIVGFSDITVLHCEVHMQGIESIHGIMPLLFPKQTLATIDSLRQTLFGLPTHIQVPAQPLNRVGKAEGQMIGGNLSLLANIIGTPSEIDTTGKILFLEDVSEYLYHLDRMMVQLHRAQKLKSLAGLVVGEFSELRDQDNSFGKTVHELIADIVAPYNYPVAYNFPIGHEQHNLSIVCGRQAYLDVKATEATLKHAI
ncbi:MAG: LD-carboxypeptidase [Bacteroidetes bacterium]|nr:MAG: LD-carboxypeptidase [Bacteroidota bacterium]